MVPSEIMRVWQIVFLFIFLVWIFLFPHSLMDILAVPIVTAISYFIIEQIVYNRNAYNSKSAIATRDAAWKKSGEEFAAIEKLSRDSKEREIQELRDFKISLPSAAQYFVQLTTASKTNFTILTQNAQQHRERYQQYLDDFDHRAYQFGIGYLQQRWHEFKVLIPQATAMEISQEARFAGTWIIAPSGQGKTNLMWHLIAKDRKRRGTVVLMDSKGQLINPYRGYGDVLVIDPKTTNINPFQIGDSDHAIDFIEYIFSMLATDTTGKQKSLFRSVLTLVTKVPEGNIDTFRRILTVGWRDLQLEQYVNRCDTATRDFFTLGAKPAFDQPTYNETKQELLWRLQLLLSKQVMQDIFLSTKTNVPFSSLLDSGKTILINNNVNELGIEGAEFFGRFFIALTWMAAITRTEIPDHQKMPVYFYIDEAQTVIANDARVPIILDECRSQKIALTLAHQRLNRINSAEVKDAMFNCAVRFASVDNDASTIANRFELPADELKLPPHQFACYVRGHTPKAVILSIPFFDTSQFPPPPPKAPPSPPTPVTEPPTQPVHARPRAVPTDEVEDF